MFFFLPILAEVDGGERKAALKRQKTKSHNRLEERLKKRGSGSGSDGKGVETKTSGGGKGTKAVAL